MGIAATGYSVNVTTVIMRKRLTLEIVLLGCSTLVAALPASAQGQEVALRAPNGRFLRAAEDGSLRPDALVPGEHERFELRAQPQGHIVLKAPGGRFLVAEGREARTLRADSPRAEPGDRETLLVVPAAEDRLALKARGYHDFVLFDAALAGPSHPSPGESLQIHEVRELPGMVQTALGVAAQALINEELAEKQYEKVRTRQRKKTVEVPAPTMRDLKRKKLRTLMSYQEQTHVTARLDGAPKIQVKQMLLLKPWRPPASAAGAPTATGADGDTGPSPVSGSSVSPAPGTMLMFAIDATLPVRGRVQYKIPDALSASTGFRTTAAITAVGQVGMRKTGDELSFQSPELLELRVQLHGLDLSNDILSAARRPIEDVVNDELEDNHDRIRQQVNKSLRKALESKPFRHPLVRFLSL